MIVQQLREVFGRGGRPPFGLSLPTGSYTVAGTRCLLRVSAHQYPRGAPLIGRLSKRGHALGFVPLVNTRGHDYSGSIDLGGLSDFSVRDLLLERAAISVQDRWGRQRVLRMDGASQVSLVRQHLDREREVLCQLDFTAGGNAQQYCGDGFSGPEEGLTWTDGPQATLVVPAAIHASASHEISFRGHPFLAPAVNSQGLTFDLNGRVRTIHVDRHSNSFLSLRYAAGDLADASEMRMTIVISDPGRPSDHSDSGDRRLLGFAFKEIVFSRLLDT